MERLLREVDDALHRMDHGRFGSCERCHGAIDTEDLNADPLRRLCLDCMTVSERVALEADLDLAFEIQGTLIPRGELTADGWRAFVHSNPAGPVGGDFVDLVELPDQKLVHFVVGDVSGKGVAAALLGSHLQALIRSSLGGERDLAERVATVNRLFAAATPAQVFATLAWGVVDRFGRGELVNAGHLPVVAIGRGGCRKLESTGVPVGLFPGARYTSTPFELAEGEQLVLFTDGVTEATDDRDREYGLDGLWSLVSTDDLDLSPEGAVSRYLGDVDRHRDGRNQHDDLTVMVLRRDCCRPLAGIAGQRLISSTL
jgi:sigma-B regulation protein RsbU (phosphoserine phosphatase)